MQGAKARLSARALVVLLVLLPSAGCSAPEHAVAPQAPDVPQVASAAIVGAPASPPPAEPTTKAREALGTEHLRRPGAVDVERGGRDRPTIVRADGTLSFDVVRGNLTALTQIGVGRVMLAEERDEGLVGPLEIGMPTPEGVERLAEPDTAATVLDVEPGGRLRLGSESLDVRPDLAKARLAEARGTGEQAGATIRVVSGSTFGDVTHAVRLLHASGFRRVQLLGMSGAVSVSDWPGARCPFPADAIRARVRSAVAIVRVVIAPTGHPSDPVIVQDPGYGMGETAQACVMRTTFEPGKDASGNPITAPTYFRVRFTTH
jgi:biopolymer transport protein ExbD